MENKKYFIIKHIITELCSNNNIKIIDLSKDDEYLKRINMSIDSFLNRSFSVRNEVVLGVYDNEELKLLSCLHEIMHIIKNYHSNDLFGIELSVWNSTFDELYKNNINISTEAEKWVLEQLKTYIL